MKTNAIDGRYLASCWVRRGCRTIVRRSSGISGGILLAFRVGIPTDSALVIYFTFRENEKGGVLCKLEPRWKSVLQSEQPASCGRSTLQMDKDLAGPSEDRSTSRAVSWEIYRMPVYRSLGCRARSYEIERRENSGNGTRPVVWIESQNRSAIYWVSWKFFSLLAANMLILHLRATIRFLKRQRSNLYNLRYVYRVWWQWNINLFLRFSRTKRGWYLGRSVDLLRAESRIGISRLAKEWICDTSESASLLILT